jgi:tyrosine-protein phosphatase SIW14
MARVLSVLLGIAMIVLLIVGPVAYAVHEHQHNLRTFRVVRDGVLYRCSQPSESALRRIVHDYGIRTVICLRDAKAPGLPVPDRWEEEFCQREEINFVRLSPQHWEGEDHAPPPVEENVHRFLEVMNDPRNHPALIHCFGGIHRTGAYCAIYRMEFEGWSNAKAIHEMVACGYATLYDEWDISNYMEQYRAGQRVKITWTPKVASGEW